MYIHRQQKCSEHWIRKYMLDLKTFCKKIEPFVVYYRKLINSYNKTAHNILEKEIKLSLPQVERKQKCGIITTLVSVS